MEKTLKLTSQQVLALAKAALHMELQAVSPVEWDFCTTAYVQLPTLGVEYFGAKYTEMKVTTFGWGYSPQSGFVKLVDGVPIDTTKYTHLIVAVYRYRFRNTNTAVNTADGCVTVYEL